MYMLDLSNQQAKRETAVEKAEQRKEESKAPRQNKKKINSLPIPKKRNGIEIG